MTDRLALMDTAQVTRLLHDALSRLRNIRFRLDRDDDDDKARQEHWEWLCACQALRFGAAQVGASGDAGMMETLEQALDLMDRFSDEPESVLGSLAKAAGRLVELEKKPSRETRRLAGHADAEVRTAIAAGLKPTGPASIELLQTLSSDAEHRVRDAARASLGPDHEAPWWSGYFAQDPAARLAEDELKRLAPVLGALRDLAGKTWFQAHDAQDRFPRLMRKLPDVLAVELGERLLKREYIREKSNTLVLADLLTRDGGVDALLRVLRFQLGRAAYEGMRVADLCERAAKFIPPDVAARVCLRLASLAGAAEPMDRLDYDSEASAIASLAGKLWPRTADPAPLLDAILAMPEIAEDANDADMDWVGHYLADGLLESTADPSGVMTRVLEARVRGNPGNWDSLRGVMDRWIARAAPAELRVAATRALASDDTRVVAWGMKELLHRAFVKAEDGTRVKLIERFWSMPHTRRALLEGEELRTSAVVPLRRALREGTTDFAVAHAAVGAIDALWGGRAARCALSDVLDEEIDGRREESRQKHRAFLGPARGHGPLTDEEWANWRAVRKAAVAADPKLMSDALEHFPPGPWHPEDRALLDRALEAVRAGDADLAIRLAFGLSANPAMEDEKVWDELIERCGPEDQRWLRKARKNVHARLGIVPVTASEPDDDDDDGWGDDEDDDTTGA